MDNLYNIEAEESVLGSVILERNSLDKIPWLEPKDFYHEMNQLLFEYMRYLNEADKPIDLALMVEEFVKHDKQEMIPYASDLFVKIASSALTAANIVYYADIVRDKSIRRRGANVGKDIENLSTGFVGTVAEYIAEMQKKIDSIKPKSNSNLEHIKEIREGFFENMKTADDFIKTDSKAFDEWGGGYARKSLIIKAGRPGVGKTAELLQDMRGICSQGEGAGALFSQEMGKNQVLQRMASCKSGLNYTRIRRKWVMGDNTERMKLEQTYNELEQLPLYIKDSSGLTIQEIKADCRELVRKVGKLSVIAVDYLSLLKIVVQQGSNKASAIGDIVWECKQMAKEFDCVFILICMMRRSEDGKKPTMNDLKDSGDIEQHADMIEFFWVEPSDESEEKGKVVTRSIEKGRDTGTGELKYIFKGFVQRFEDYTPPKKESKKK